MFKIFSNYLAYILPVFDYYDPKIILRENFLWRHLKHLFFTLSKDDTHFSKLIGVTKRGSKVTGSTASHKNQRRVYILSPSANDQTLLIITNIRTHRGRGASTKNQGWRDQYTHSWKRRSRQMANHKNPTICSVTANGEKKEKKKEKPYSDYTNTDSFVYKQPSLSKWPQKRVRKKHSEVRKPWASCFFIPQFFFPNSIRICRVLLFFYALFNFLQRIKLKFRLDW